MDSTKVVIKSLPDRDGELASDGSRVGFKGVGSSYDSALSLVRTVGLDRRSCLDENMRARANSKRRNERHSLPVG